MDKSVIATLLASQTRVLRPPPTSVDTLNIASDEARACAVNSRGAAPSPSVVGISTTSFYKVACFDQGPAVVVPAVRLETLVRPQHASPFVVLQHLGQPLAKPLMDLYGLDVRRATIKIAAQDKATRLVTCSRPTVAVVLLGIAIFVRELVIEFSVKAAGVGLVDGTRPFLIRLPLVAGFKVGYAEVQLTAPDAARMQGHTTYGVIVARRPRAPLL